MKKIFNIVFFGAILALAACSDYLNIDRYFNDEFKIDSIFTSKRYIEAYMWGAADLMPDEGQIFSANNGTPGPLATDEAFTMFNITNVGSYAGMRLVLGDVNPDNPNPFWSATWQQSYKAIRKCNTILARIDEAPDMTASERLSIQGYTRFIRAYAYYRIIVDYGPPILLGDEIVANNEEMAYYDRPRSTYDEAVDYVCSELEAAGEAMPLTVSLLQFGRPTRGAAFALAARLRLLQASPLFNGGAAAKSYFSDWTLPDGKHYISQNYDEKKWAVAAAAAKRIIDMENAGAPLYKLYTIEADGNTPELPKKVTSDPAYYNNYPNGAAGIDHFRSYSEMFNGECVAQINPEFIWAYTSSGLLTYTQASFPFDHGGWSGMAVTQKVVDAYRMVDGHTIEDSSEDYPYSESGFSGSVSQFSGYQLNAGVYNMYVNREMRFYANVGFSERLWPCLSATSAGDSRYTVTYYYDSSSGKSNPSITVNYTPTGYVVTKYIHPQDAFSGTNARRIPKVFPIVRFAEILLSYAEALNNLSGSHTVGQQTFSRDREAIRQAFNQVRYRAGLPGLTDAELADPATVQALIEQERMTEFMFENRRYYDVRRWGIYEETENEPVMGMNVDAGKEGYYNRVIPVTSRISNRIVNKKLAFLPLSRTELRRLPSVSQNPGW